MGRGYGIEQWEIEEMNERLKGIDPLFDNHPTVVEQRKRTAEFVESLRHEQNNSELVASPVALRKLAKALRDSSGLEPGERSRVMHSVASSLEEIVAPPQS